MKTVAQLIEELMEMPLNAPVSVVIATEDEDGEGCNIKYSPDPYLSIFGEVWLT